MRVPDETLGAWRAFLNAHALATKRINRDLAEAGLPDLTWYDVLWTLHRADGRRLRIRELADAVVLSSTGMTRFVDRLEAGGLVRREAVPGDRRGAYAVAALCCAGCGRSTRGGSRPTSDRPCRRAPTCAPPSTASLQPLSPAASREPARWRA